MADCEHKRITPAVLDQTIGVVCVDCGHVVAVEWMEDTIPVQLWNEAVRQTKERGDKDCEDWKPAEPKVCWRCHIDAVVSVLIDTTLCTTGGAHNPKWRENR